MFKRIQTIIKDAEVSWKDAILIVFISMALMLLTNHIADKLCN